MAYLARWTARLAEGVSRFDEDRRRRLIDFFQNRQRDDGGWSGRQGGSDLYYSSFALRGLRLLDGLDRETAFHVRQFLNRFAERADWPVVDLFSYAVSTLMLEATGEGQGDSAAWSTLGRLVEKTSKARSVDEGGFALSSSGKSGSTYATFLMVLLRETFGFEPVEAERVDSLVQWVHGQQRFDGGFAELAPIKKGGTNPTAAALGTLQEIGRLDPAMVESASRFLLDRQTEEGGYSANGCIPIADLLSTFSALVTLEDLGKTAAIDRVAVLNFLDRLESLDGGYRAAVWDPETDVEFTFYGMAVRALLI